MLLAEDDDDDDDLAGLLGAAGGFGNDDDDPGDEFVPEATPPPLPRREKAGARGLPVRAHACFGCFDACAAAGGCRFVRCPVHDGCSSLAAV